MERALLEEMDRLFNLVCFTVTDIAVFYFHCMEMLHGDVYLSLTFSNVFNFKWD